MTYEDDHLPPAPPDSIDSRADPVFVGRAPDEDLPASNGFDPAPEESEAVEPVLRAPESLTPLPAVDRALPILSIFGGIVGRRRARYKIAILKTLQADGSGRWKIRRLQEVVHWMEASSVTDLVAELRIAGVLTYDVRSGYYRLTPDARVVTAILDALTVPEIDPRRLIKFLSKAMSLALAAGAGQDAVFGQFASAVAVLRADWEEMKSLVDDLSESALLAAAELVRAHVDDMRDLLNEHDSFFAEHRRESLFLDREQEALDLIARLGKLSAEVIQALAGRANERMRAGMRIDRADLREYIAQASLDSLAALVEGLAAPSPFVVWLPGDAMFDALVEIDGRERATPPPLPEPERLVRSNPQEHQDLAAELAKEAMALVEATTLERLVIRDSWMISVGRHSALIEAYSRNGTPLPVLEHDTPVDEPRRAGVWRVSRTTLRPRS